jgi:hypothetical protein
MVWNKTIWQPWAEWRHEGFVLIVDSYKKEFNLLNASLYDLFMYAIKNICMVVLVVQVIALFNVLSSLRNNILKGAF